MLSFVAIAAACGTLALISHVALARVRFIEVTEAVVARTAPVGSLAIVERVNVERLSPRDVILYRHPDFPGRRVLVRVEEQLTPMLPLASGRVLRLGGEGTDPPVVWDAELHGVVWRLVAAIPTVGWAAFIEPAWHGPILVGLIGLSLLAAFTVRGLTSSRAHYVVR